MGVPVSINSTDNFWYRDDPSIYNFNPKLLGRAHDWNKENTEMDMKNGIEAIIIDNTNTTSREVNPYIRLAEKYGYNVRLVSVDCNIELAKERNSERPEDRKVPEGVIDKQKNKMAKYLLD